MRACVWGRERKRGTGRATVILVCRKWSKFEEASGRKRNSQDDTLPRSKINTETESAETPEDEAWVCITTSDTMMVCLCHSRGRFKSSSVHLWEFLNSGTGVNDWLLIEGSTTTLPWEFGLSKQLHVQVCCPKKYCLTKVMRLIFPVFKVTHFPFSRSLCWIEAWESSSNSSFKFKCRASWPQKR